MLVKGIVHRFFLHGGSSEESLLCKRCTIVQLRYLRSLSARVKKTGVFKEKKHDLKSAPDLYKFFKQIQQPNALNPCALIYELLYVHKNEYST